VFIRERMINLMHLLFVSFESNIFVDGTRVTRLGEFSLIGRLLSLGIFF
jgi:hypothetical protein